MDSALAWFGALKRWQRRAFRRSVGERVPIRPGAGVAPGRSWRTPDVRIVEHERRVEFALHLPGAVADSTRIGWNEETQTLSIHAVAPGDAPTDPTTHSAHSTSEPSGRDWYAEVQVPSDVDGSRAEAFLRDGTLRIIAPRVDSNPLTGLPLFVWADACDNGSFALST